MARIRYFGYTRRTALALLGGIGLCGLACAPAVYAERKSEYALESAQTYAWVTDELILIKFGADQSTVRTKQNEQWIRAAVDRELQARGVVTAPRDSADLLVGFSVGTDVRYRLEGGDGTAVTTDGPAKPQVKGTLNLYVIDREGGEQVWHGWTSRWLHRGMDPHEMINTAVAKIMAAYPNQAP